MLSRYAKGKTSVFIDAANVFYAERSLGWRIDFEKLANYLRSELTLSEICYYSGFVTDNTGQQKFLKKLEYFGYTVITKEVKSLRQTHEKPLLKANFDVEIALDAYIGRSQYDTFILFSGDSDFAYLLDLLKRENKRLIIVSTRGHISKELLLRAKYLALPKLRLLIERIDKFKGPA